MCSVAQEPAVARMIPRAFHRLHRPRCWTPLWSLSRSHRPSPTWTRRASPPSTPSAQLPHNPTWCHNLTHQCTPTHRATSTPLLLRPTPPLSPSLLLSPSPPLVLTSLPSQSCWIQPQITLALRLTQPRTYRAVPIRLLCPRKPCRTTQRPAKVPQRSQTSSPNLETCWRTRWVLAIHWSSLLQIDRVNIQYFYASFLFLSHSSRKMRVGQGQSLKKKEMRRMIQP